MRVLYICNEYPPAIHGGIGVYVRTLAEKLAAAGHDAAVIGFASHVRESGQAVENGVRVARLPWPRRRMLHVGRFRVDSSALAARKLLSWEAARLARAFCPDVMESHDWSGPLWTPPWRPLIVRMHGASSVYAALQRKRAGRLVRFFERRNLRMADALVSASEFNGRGTLDALRLSGKPFTTIHHGIDTREFQPGAAPRDPLEVLFAGTVKKQKGIQELFRAMPAVFAAFPKARLTIAGSYPANPADPCSPSALWRSLSAGGRPGGDCLARSRVRFLGHVPRHKLPRLYARAAVAVFPSHREAFGLTCAEAMSCGAAVVMTARDSGPELVEHGKSGLLVEPADTPALASAIIGLLGNGDLRRRLGLAARGRVLEKFSIDDAVARNLAFYGQVARDLGTRQTVDA